MIFATLICKKSRFLFLAETQKSGSKTALCKKKTKCEGESELTHSRSLELDTIALCRPAAECAIALDRDIVPNLVVLIDILTIADFSDSGSSLELSARSLHAVEGRCSVASELMLYVSSDILYAFASVTVVTHAETKTEAVDGVEIIRLIRIHRRAFRRRVAEIQPRILIDELTITFRMNLARAELSCEVHAVSIEGHVSACALHIVPREVALYVANTTCTSEVVTVVLIKCAEKTADTEEV